MEKLKDKSMLKHIIKEVKGRESRGPRNFEWNTDLSHRDEEARELHLPGCTGLVQKKRHNTKTSRSTTLQNLHTKMFGWIENAAARKGNVNFESRMVRMATTESL